MKKSAIIIALVNCCAFLFSQDLQFSREFERIKKNLPIAIINHHSHYYHVLRNNRAIHDFTVERRKKSNSEIIAFTALRLDSVNANWFDYSNLDYILHENNHELYFIFERVLNNKREIFIKSIDTLGRSNGFKSLSVLESAPNIESIEFSFYLCSETELMIVGTKNYSGGSSKKTVELFDIKNKNRIWFKHLPPENANTGYSDAFAVNAHGDLYFVLIKSELSHYKRIYQDHKQMQIPVFFYSGVELNCLDKHNANLYKLQLPLNEINALNALTIHTNDSTVSVFSQYAKGESPKEEKLFYLRQQFSSDLSKEYYMQDTSINASIENQLTYFDGSDYNTAADKNFAQLGVFESENYFIELLEHQKSAGNEEVLFVKWNKANGEIMLEQLIPRKSNFEDERIRMKNIGRVNWMTLQQGNAFLIHENPSNEKLELTQIKHKTFKKLKSVYRANVMLYHIDSTGRLNRKLIYRGDNFASIPVNYQSNQTEYILFLDGSKKEKFAILKMNPF